MNRRRVLATLPLFTLAGCAGDESTEPPTDEPTATATDTPTSTSEPTATGTPAPTTDVTDTATATSDGTPRTSEPPTATPSPTAEPVAQTVEVAAEGLSFTPSSFEIAAGETVRWVWRAGQHNVVADQVPDGSGWTGTPGAPDETFGEGYTYEATFEVAGAYTYYCQPHRSLGMTGSFDVV